MVISLDRIGSILRQNWLLSFLIAFDFLSKILLYVVLPLEKSIFLLDGFRLILQTNEFGLGSEASRLFGSNAIPILSLSFSHLLVACMAWYVRGKTWSAFSKVFLCGVAFVVLTLLSIATSVIFHVEWSNRYLVTLLGRVGAIVLVLTVYHFIRERYFKIAFAFLSAAGLGNFLSYFYPPFKVVDFMYSDLFRVLFKVQVCNFADLYVPVGIYIVILSPIYLLTRSGKQKIEQK
jgi:lipoprotein signal peptidase